MSARCNNNWHEGWSIHWQFSMTRTRRGKTSVVLTMAWAYCVCKLFVKLVYCWSPLLCNTEIPAFTTEPAIGETKVLRKSGPASFKIEAISFNLALCSLCSLGFLTLL